MENGRARSVIQSARALNEMNSSNSSPNHPASLPRTEKTFYASMWGLSSIYIVLVGLMLVAAITKTSWSDLVNAFNQPALRHSFWLTMLTSSIATIVALLCSVPLAYLTSRQSGRRSKLLGLLLDVPNVLPPLVLGLMLLILFSGWPFSTTLLSGWQDSIIYQPAAVIIAQFVVATSFALPALKNTFDQIDPRREAVAQTLGCTRGQAFWRSTLSEAWPAIISTGSLAWARCLGCFGPVLVFAGATRNKTEVLATSVYLELIVGDLKSSLAIAMLMILLAVIVLSITRWLASDEELADA